MTVLDLDVVENIIVVNVFVVIVVVVVDIKYNCLQHISLSTLCLCQIKSFYSVFISPLSIFPYKLL